MLTKIKWYYGCVFTDEQFRKNTLDQRFNDFSKRLEAAYKYHNIPYPDYGCIKIMNIPITRWFQYDSEPDHRCDYSGLA